MGDHMKLLARLAKQPGNATCADCGDMAPTWASVKLGLFLCLRCSGIHRSLGTHISFVRSVTLDSWRPEQVQNMVKYGNVKANSFWEANLPDGFVRPVDTGSVTRFINDKYVHRRFAMSAEDVAREKAKERDQQPPPVAAHKTAKEVSSEKPRERKKKKKEGTLAAPERSRSASPAAEGKTRALSARERRKLQQEGEGQRESEQLQQQPISAPSTPVSVGTVEASLLDLGLDINERHSAPPPTTDTPATTTLTSTTADSWGMLGDLMGAPAAQNTQPSPSPGAAGQMDSIMALFDQPAAVFHPSK